MSKSAQWQDLDHPRNPPPWAPPPQAQAAQAGQAAATVELAAELAAVEAPGWSKVALANKKSLDSSMAALASKLSLESPGWSKVAVARSATAALTAWLAPARMAVVAAWRHAGAAGAWALALATRAMAMATQAQVCHAGAIMAMVPQVWEAGLASPRQTALRCKALDHASTAALLAPCLVCAIASSVGKRLGRKVLSLRSCGCPSEHMCFRLAKDMR